MSRAVRPFTLLTLLVVVTGAASLSAARNRQDLQTESCAPCKRSVCQQICGPQRPAFCDTDPVTGCPVCACNG
jgi:hypothetical protein